jgi:argininosuccinate lyase
VLWCSHGFGFVTLSDAFTTGSSIMPQKRNPDGAELLRGKSGRVIAAFNGLMLVMKGLPLAYAKDMQEDKEPVFDTADTLLLCLQVAAGMVRDLRPDSEALRQAAETGYLTATDLADWLVRSAGLPFREAHHVTGILVKQAADTDRGLQDLTLAEMQAVESRISEGVYEVLAVERAVESRTSFGGTAPDLVRKAVATARERYL